MGSIQTEVNQVGESPIKEKDEGDGAVQDCNDGLVVPVLDLCGICAFRYSNLPH